MLKREFLLDNLVDLFDESGILLRFGSSREYLSLRDILERFSDLSLEDKRELFSSAIDLLEARVFLRLLTSEDGKLIGGSNSENIRKVFSDFREMLDDLLSDGVMLKDYRANLEVLKRLRVANLEVLEGGKS
jgi:hypothetical protein